MNASSESLNAYDPQRAFATPIPPHRAGFAQPVPARTLHTWPVGTFVENLCALGDGALAVSVHSERRIDRFRDGRMTPLAQFAKTTFSLLSAGSDALYVVVGEIGTAPAEIHLIGAGTQRAVATLAESTFPNGSAPFLPGTMLVADSLAGTIFLVDLQQGSVRPWLRHALLQKITAEPMLPGANGMKIFGGTVYVSNTDRAILLAIDVDPAGRPSEPRVIADELRADDFAFAASGTMYLTTHIHNTVMRLERDGGRRDIAGPAHGMAGSTAVAFGIGGDATTLYATTTGGVIAPHDGIAEPAKLVALEVGERGAPIAGLPA